ncbi:cysteine-rich secretory protein 3-like [Suncus etruscus]|uniref:cysteine-rich secretory protein 3-like n=1 Tax=Suncus etruscus TaxID=109475 RepID=UPI002110CFD6|nr:cysteine-rich secretory protein 3-like [Suncus etruscus]
MALFPVLLSFTAVLFSFFPANGQDSFFDSLSTSLPAIQTEIVDKHNECRRTVIPPATNMVKMAWSTEAAKRAQEWANKCTLQHSPEELRKISTSGCGENLFMASYPATWTEAIDSWNDEKEDFIYGIGPKSPGAVIGHYTQVVWFSSALLGCGAAYCPNARLQYYYVCRYCPAGNLQSKKHVPYINGTRCAACPNDCDNGLCTNSCIQEDKYGNCKSLVGMLGCDHELTKNGCEADCQCQNKIH